MPAHVRDLFSTDNYEEGRVMRSQQRLCVPAHKDRVLVRDKRVRENLLMLESSKKVLDYCGTGVQREVAPHMRKIVTDWMLEVCEDQQCQPQVFFLAVSYLDRFLSSLSITKTQFQLLASVCILLASKFSQVVPITTEQLVIYTDNSISKQELLEWEILALQVLHWEISTSTVNCFLNLLYNCFNISDKVQKQCEALAIQAVTEYRFLQARDSVLAGAVLATALKEELGNSEELLEVISVISSTIKCDLNDIFISMYHLVSDHSCHQEKQNRRSGDQEKQNKLLREERPSTPDDVLNISQSEIIV